MSFLAQKEIAVSPLVHPLDDFYAQAGLVLPRMERISGEEMPQPQKSLLVHENDMTPTLENFYRDSIHLNVLRREQRGDFYHRNVILLTDRDLIPVEFGAIKIALNLFPASARREILEERMPLGTLLAKYKIHHTSRPKAFMKIEPDEFIRESLKIRNSRFVYARRNTLSDTQGRPLAEIFEILP